MNSPARFLVAFRRGATGTAARDAHAGRGRATARLRHQLREYFPAALQAFEDLDAPDTVELPRSP